ncbi:hypothetical protein PDJAM_G00112430 [Pangasius djambal]|uniref:Uncharacterized protein n=1 Tax=Pangasius djambal TaxID=1691987 RepID=A0ACC5Y2H3_9TELE|nr:hypothetical protein [Pangasius djambal]
MEADKQKVQTEKVQVTDCDLSEQIKAVTKESHVRAENTELMLAFQRGNINLQQHKLLLCSLYKIYEVLEEELDRNASHDSGQVLGRIIQKSLGLKNGEGMAFFSFPTVSSPNLFKQLYRSRMNSIELTETQREGVLEEAVRAFEFNIQVFDELQNLVSISEKNELRQRHKAHNLKTPDVNVSQSSVLSSSLTSTSQLLRMLLGACLALAVGMGMYAF